MLGPLNAWIGRGVRPRQPRCHGGDAGRLAGPGQAGIGPAGPGTKRLADSESRLRRHQEAIDAGVDPAALVEVINPAQAERAAAQAELTNVPADNTLTAAEVYAMIDYLGDVGAALNDGKPESLSRLYQRLRLDLRYKPQDNAVEVTSTLRVVSGGVGGGT